MILGAEGVIALNETEAEHYCELGVDDDRIAIIPNGIDLANILDLPVRVISGQRGHRRSQEIVLYLGRLDLTKGSIS